MRERSRTDSLSIMDTELPTIRSLTFLLLAGAARIERSLDLELSRIKGISFSEYQLLAALQASHGSSATRVALAGAIGLTPSGVTRALKPLEKIGLVTTIKDARDARRSLAELTPAGAELVEDSSAAVDSVLMGLAPFADLGVAERASLAKILGGLARV